MKQYQRVVLIACICAALVYVFSASADFLEKQIAMKEINYAYVSAMMDQSNELLGNLQANGYNGKLVDVITRNHQKIHRHLDLQISTFENYGPSSPRDVRIAGIKVSLLQDIAIRSELNASIAMGVLERHINYIMTRKHTHDN